MWLAGFTSKQAFENLAHKALEEHSNKAGTQIASQLEPFRRDMANLQQSVIDSTKERFSLKEQIEQIGQQANNLADALTSQPKIRGNWGEVVLQKMLEDSGLREGKDYEKQASLKGDEGQRLLPDIKLCLPEGKHIIIDSKLSLLSYQNYVEETGEPQKAHFAEFVRSTRKHVDDLASKNYPHAREIESPDFTMMFMPIEGAFVSLMQGESNLQKYAWDKKIVITSPSILFAMLQTVASLWRLDSQNKNSDEIARLGGALYDKIASFDNDMKKLGSQLEVATKTFDDTHRKLSSGKGNILSRTEKLQELGARTSKQLTNIGD